MHHACICMAASSFRACSLALFSSASTSAGDPGREYLRQRVSKGSKEPMNSFRSAWKMLPKKKRLVYSRNIRTCRQIGQGSLGEFVCLFCSVAGFLFGQVCKSWKKQDGARANAKVSYIKYISNYIILYACVYLSTYMSTCMYIHVYIYLYYHICIT